MDHGPFQFFKYNTYILKWTMDRLNSLSKNTYIPKWTMGRLNSLNENSYILKWTMGRLNSFNKIRIYSNGPWTV